MILRRFSAPIAFAAVATAVYATAFYIRSILGGMDAPAVLAAALVLDMVVLVPAAYWFFIVRRYRLPIVSVAGMFVLSLLAATWVIPDDLHAVLVPVEILAVVGELSLLGFIVWKAAKGVRRYRAAAAGVREGEDAMAAIRTAAREAVGSERVAGMLAHEIAVLYYGLGCWRRRPSESPGRFTSYKRNNYGSTLFGIGVLLTAELIAVHVLVQMYWSTVGAWILSILTAYAGVWLASEWHSHRLRPSVVAADGLVLRSGIRWDAFIPFERIRSLRRVSAIEDKPKGTLNLVGFGDADFEIVTDAPVQVRGIYGLKKTTNSIWFSIDDPDGFLEAMSARVDASG